MTPRPVPSRVLPTAAGGAVVAFALPAFLLAGWPVAGWALGATLWTGLEAVDVLVARARAGADSLARSGVLAFGMLFKALAALAVLVGAAATDASLGVAAIAVFALAYTLKLGLSLATYFGAAP